MAFVIAAIIIVVAIGIIAFIISRHKKNNARG